MLATRWPLWSDFGKDEQALLEDVWGNKGPSTRRSVPARSPCNDITGNKMFRARGPPQNV